MTNSDFDPSELIDNEEDIINIDTSFIDDNALKEAEGMIENLKDLYTDPEFLKANPKFATRLQSEIESLRILLKVRKSDEAVHDVLLGSIGKNPSIICLYCSLVKGCGMFLFTSSTNWEQCSAISSIVKS